MTAQRYYSVYVVTYNANSAVEAESIAAAHHAQICDLLRVEGAGTPYEIALEHVYREGDRSDLLGRPKRTPID